MMAILNLLFDVLIIAGSTHVDKLQQYTMTILIKMLPTALVLITLRSELLEFLVLSFFKSAQKSIYLR